MHLFLSKRNFKIELFSPFNSIYDIASININQRSLKILVFLSWWFDRFKMKYTVAYTLRSHKFLKFRRCKKRNICLETCTLKTIHFKKYMQWDLVLEKFPLDNCSSQSITPQISTPWTISLQTVATYDNCYPINNPRSTPI